MSATAFLLVDVQQGFEDTKYWGLDRSNAACEGNIEQLLKHFRSLTPPPLIIHVQHHSLNETSPLHASSPGNAFKHCATPLDSELIITKNQNSAFIGTKLESVLRQHKIRKLFVCGLTTDQCVSTTVRMAANLCVCDWNGAKGDVIMVGDATAAWGYQNIPAQTIHKVHEATLKEEFCRVISAEGALKETNELL